ncbi:MAG: transposase [Anaerobutyricum soehngenii]
MVLHTFGWNLKWNPHIHCLISEGSYNDDGFWRHVKYLNSVIIFLCLPLRRFLSFMRSIKIELSYKVKNRNTRF